MYSKNTFHQGVCNDGGSHVETSSICAVPLLWALYGLVVSSITWRSQAQPLLINYSHWENLKGETTFIGSVPIFATAKAMSLPCLHLLSLSVNDRPTHSGTTPKLIVPV